jgi:di/tricarboxylate transporter
MLSASFDILSIVEATVIGSIILLVLRSISIEEAYESINWPVIFLIALLVPIGIAMENTGTGQYLSTWITHIAQIVGPTPEIQAIRVVCILYFITFLSSAFVSNAAVAIILSPLAIILGKNFIVLDPTMDPTRAFLMAICFGASTSFMTPIGYQTNLMVFAPGQYRFKDFLYAGLPLTLIFWIIASYYIPILFPFK